MDHTHGDHGHTHGGVDPSIATTSRGMWAIKWSFIGLLLTALIQVVVVVFSGSVALLADTIHNFGDAGTAIPLWIAMAHRSIGALLGVAALLAIAQAVSADRLHLWWSGLVGVLGCSSSFSWSSTMESASRVRTSLICWTTRSSAST